MEDGEGKREGGRKREGEGQGGGAEREMGDSSGVYVTGGPCGLDWGGREAGVCTLCVTRVLCFVLMQRVVCGVTLLFRCCAAMW